MLYLWSSGNAARLRERLKRSIRNTPLLRFTYGAVLALLAGLAAFPASFAVYRVDVTFDLTPEPALNWIRDGLLSAAVEAVSAGLVVALVFWLVDRTRLWYAYASIGLFAATLMLAFLEPVMLAPLFNRFKPLSTQSPIYAPLRRLEAAAHLGGAPIYVADYSKRTAVPVADVAGFGATKRIVLGDTLLESSTLPEVLFVTAREFGHYAHADDFRLSLFWTSLFIFCTGVGVVATDRVRFRRDDDPLTRLTLVLAFMGLAGLVVTPIYNGYSRNLEGRADRYALALTHDRVAAARAFIRTADKALAPLCASRPILLYFYNSPPLGTRIAAATGQRDPCRT
jgi:STE24 endopeptidase